jgi:integrase
VLLSAYGGLRIGELAGLRRDRIDLLRGTVDIAEIVVEVRGQLYTGPPKTRAGRRTVGLPRAVVEELAAHMGPAGRPGGRACVHRREGRDSSDLQLPRQGVAPCRAPGRPGAAAPHDLRHTAVALWIAAGANPKEVSVRAGHTSVSFTLDRYGHLFPGHDAELRNRLDAMHTKGLQQSLGRVVVDLPSDDPGGLDRHPVRSAIRWSDRGGRAIMVGMVRDRV